MKLHMDLGEHSYDIVLQSGGLSQLKDYVNLDRQVMIITDTGVPTSFVDIVKAQCPHCHVYVTEQGEDSKSIAVYSSILKELLHQHFSRSDLIIALGGGVMGDLGGFVAASYMRGIDFVNCPTTTLSQIDSSIGGKVGINLDGTKNIVGAFHQPKFVMIDPDTLNTLTSRHFSAGLAEAVKAGMIYDPTLFELFETHTIDKHSPQLEQVLYASLCMKKSFVEADEKEAGVRAALNFGHTIGHGIESQKGLGGLYHGECVALGMLPMTQDPTLKQRLLSIYRKLQLPTSVAYNGDQVYEALLHDKKGKGNTTKVVKVKTLGTYEFEVVDNESLRPLIGEGIS